MRLILTTTDLSKANQLANLLNQNQIENQLEINTNKDWGSHDYGLTSCQLWVYDEEQFQKAQELVDAFNANPHDPQFGVPPGEPPPFIKSSPVNPDALSPPVKSPLEPMGRITRFLLLICTFLFISAALSEPTIKKAPPAYLPMSPIYLAPINKALMYDYPQTYELVDHLVETYGLEALRTPNDLPDDGKLLIEKLEKTPYWEGIYPKLVASAHGSPINWREHAPMFEKIKQGEVWRLFTPCLLHNDFFHLFFNMIWLVILGRQIEARIGSGRYILFIIVTAIITNTAQYLMSGPNFLGFSGVLCAMLTFIWIRQKKAGWEGYKLERSTLGFIVFFILFMFTLQLASFVIEAKTDNSFPIAIANTAHLLGGALGFLLAHFKFFMQKV